MILQLGEIIFRFFTNLSFSLDIVELSRKGGINIQMKTRFLKWAMASLTVIAITGSVGIASADDDGHNGDKHKKEQDSLSTTNLTNQDAYRAKVQKLLETAF